MPYQIEHVVRCKGDRLFGAVHIVVANLGSHVGGDQRQPGRVEVGRRIVHGHIDHGDVARGEGRVQRPKVVFQQVVVDHGPARRHAARYPDRRPSQRVSGMRKSHEVSGARTFGNVHAVEAQGGLGDAQEGDHHTDKEAGTEAAVRHGLLGGCCVRRQV